MLEVCEVVVKVFGVNINIVNVDEGTFLLQLAENDSLEGVSGIAKINQHCVEVKEPFMIDEGCFLFL